MKDILRKFIPSWMVSAYHFLLAVGGAIIYRFPSNDLIVIGVTGTNGKSTVVEILHEIFSEFGFRVASFSSVRFRVLGQNYPAKVKMTMPGRFFLQKMLNRARREGCQYAIVEVTSEGIKQFRHVGIRFDAAVFTNLQPEHIESHGSFEAYREAKGRLFEALGRRKRGVNSRIIVNLDDPSAFYYLHFDADRKVGFGLLPDNVRDGVEPVVPANFSFRPDGFSFEWRGMKWESPLVGDFNLYNILAAVATAVSFSIPLGVIRSAITRVRGVPGRLEVVADHPFRVVVDYAHTPDALEAVYRTVRSLWVKADKRLIAVLGAAGGGRDRWKRPELGKIAERFADSIILTNEDPYNEDPRRILEEVAAKMTEGKHEIILNRREAISHALRTARDGDVVIITGKGSEQAIVERGTLVPWDDRVIVQELLDTPNVQPST